jgi:hypothetical protein
MYAAGFMQTQIWVQRKSQNRSVKTDRATFIRRLDKLTDGWTDNALSRLFALFIRIIEAQKEVDKLRNKNK